MAGLFNILMLTDHRDWQEPHVFIHHAAGGNANEYSGTRCNFMALGYQLNRIMILLIAFQCYCHKVTIFLTILIAKSKARAKDLTQEKERDPKEMYLLRFNRMKIFLAAHIAVCDLFIFPPICWKIPMKQI